jgi:NitT/TauT family transport system ATP-binding protein
MTFLDSIVLECQQVNHWFGDNKILFDINLRVIRGEIVALVGPSGCGKSTLLRGIIGTHPPCQGDIIMRRHGQADAWKVSQPGRDRGIVYQQYSLFPFLTALENVAMGLMLDQTSIPFRLFRFPRWLKLRKQHLNQAETILDQLKLGHAIDKYPHQMSGGMRQRVAIAQTLIMKPELILLDEPFGALDEATREELQRMLLALYHENCQAKQAGQLPPYTIMIVTHELNEAIYVGDRVVALSQFWNWKEKGFDQCPGATIVYDDIAPVFDPDQERNFDVFRSQRNLIRRTAFDPDFLQDRAEFIRFWKEIQSGKGEGVLRQ